MDTEREKDKGRERAKVEDREREGGKERERENERIREKGEKDRYSGRRRDRKVFRASSSSKSRICIWYCPSYS